MTSTEVSTAVAPAGRDVLSEVPVKALPGSKQVAMDAVEDIVYGSVSLTIAKPYIRRALLT
jgi:hypothetical protein